MKTNKIILFCAALVCVATLSAAPNKDGVEIVKCNRRAQSSFAIIVDKTTYDACRAAINSYRDVLQSEGLATYIFAADWQSPDQVKKYILTYASKRPALEGVVFVGDVPIAKVGGAQHMTTAFKMNEERFPREESWVATDRFYDDFDLEFDFVERDSVDTNIFYYRLNENGAQRLAPEIYSARMVVPSLLGDKYEILNNYLAEVVAAHKENNPLDDVTFYAGSGYNSDCLTIWRQKPNVWREYFPYAFGSTSHNRFFNYRQGTDVKHRLFNEIQRPNVDYFQFSEHGAPDTQYITEREAGHSLESDLKLIRSALLSYYEDYKGTPDEEGFLAECETEFGVPRSYFTDENMAANKQANAIATAESNIGLSEIAKLKSAPRFMVFNACYNGSFHDKEGYVAGCHVFNGGRTVVAQGNTVNVLQDKYEDQLLGMLSVGVRVGVWQKEVAFLESHLIGDPTFRFTPHNDAEAQMAKDITYNKDTKFWAGQCNSAEPLMRAVALKRLYNSTADKAQLSDKIADIAMNDSSWEVRLEALHLSGLCADANTVKVVAAGMNDQYERIRRMSADLAGEIGDEQFIEPLQKIIDHADEVQRVQMTASSSLEVIAPNPESRRAINVALIADTSASENKRISEIRSLRNNHLHSSTDEFTTVLCNNADNLHVRVVMCEALGWFDRSVARPKILAALAKLVADESTPAELRSEAIKSQKRLTE